MTVAAIVLEQGGDEDLAIAALLHDAVEDQGGRRTLNRIRRLFGERVAGIVESCSDAIRLRKPPWRERKRKYVEHIRNSPPDVRLVSLADKLHNAGRIAADLRTHGNKVWARFSGGKSGTLWYYRELVHAYRLAGSPPEMVDELERLVTRMRGKGSGRG